MADSSDPPDTTTNDAALALQAGLKSCHKILDSYRAKLGEQPAAAPPAETIESSPRQD